MKRAKIADHKFSFVQSSLKPIRVAGLTVGDPSVYEHPERRRPQNAKLRELRIAVDHAAKVYLFQHTTPTWKIILQGCRNALYAERLRLGL